MQRWKQIFRTIASSITVLVLVLVLALFTLCGWLLHSESGARVVISALTKISSVPLNIQGVHGSIVGPLHIERVVIDDAKRRIAIDNLRLAWTPEALLQTQLHITSLSVERLSIIHQFERNPTPLTLPDNIALPIALQIDAVSIAGGEIGWDLFNVIQLGSARFQLSFDRQRYQMQLDRLDTRSTVGEERINSSMRGQMTLGTSKPFALHAVFESSSTAKVQEKNITAQGKILIDGALNDMTINLELATKQGGMKGSLVLKPFEKQILASALIDAQDLDLSAWRADLPRTALYAHLSARADGIGQLTLTNRAAGLYSTGQLPLMNVRLAFRKSDEALIVDTFFAQLGVAQQPAGKLEGNARYSKGALTLKIGIDALNLHRLDQRLQSTLLAGTVDVQHAAGKQHMTIDLREPVGKQKAALTARATLADLRLVLQKAELRVGSGSIGATGYIDLLGIQSFHAEGNMHHFRLHDIAKFAQLPALDLNGKFTLHGARQPRLTGDLSFQMEDSTLAGRLLQGQGQVQLRTNRIVVPKLFLMAGDNRLDVHGELSPADGQLFFTLSAPQLAQLCDGCRGAFQATGNVRGSFQKPHLTMSWRGEKLQLQELIQAENVQGSAMLVIHHEKSTWLGSTIFDAVKLDISGRNVKAATRQLASFDAHVQFARQDNAPLMASLFAEGLKIQDRGIDQLSIDKIRFSAKGTTAEHTLDATLADANNRQQLALQAKGSLYQQSSASNWQGWSWDGLLTRLDATGRISAQLDAPATFAWSAQHMKLNRLRIKSHDVFVHVDEIMRDANGFHSSGSLGNVSLAQILLFTRPNTMLTTDLQLNGEWDVRIADDITGHIVIKRQSGDIVLRESTPIALGLRTFEASAKAKNGQIAVRIAADGQQLGHINAQAKLAMDNRNRFAVSENTPISGEIKIDTPSLAWLGSVFSNSVVTEGRLVGKVALSGSLDQPNFKGNISASDVRILHLDSGLDMRQGVLESELDGDTLRLKNLRFQSKNGSIVASGIMQLSEKKPRADIVIKADHFAVLDRSDRQLVWSGSSQLAWRDQRANLKGTFDVNAGFFDIGRADMPQLSDDVVVIGRDKKSGVPMLMSLDIKVNLGEGVKLKGKGLDALLQGQVQLSSEANQALKAQGTIRVAQGTYTAYGRQLAIDRGTLRFNGPLFNPAIDIAAMRHGQEVTAGVAVFGTVMAPRVNLISDPSVSEAEKLSWLVLGRPLDNMSNTDLGALQGAASILLSQGALSAVQSQIATAFGVDDVRIASSQDNVQQRIITLGKRVSSQLYVSYEQSLQAASSVLLLRYSLSPRLTVEAEAGTRSAMSLLYTVLFD